MENEGSPSENSQPTNEELIKRLEALEAHNAKLESTKERLLNDSKDWKRKYQSVKSETESKVQAQLEEQNDFKGLYERGNDKIMELTEELNKTKRNSLKSALKFEVSKNATDAQDVDLLLSAIQGKKEQIAYDSESDQWQGVGEVIGELRTEKPFLFKKDKTGMVNGRPSNEPPKEKSVRDILKENPEAALEVALGDFLK